MNSLLTSLSKFFLGWYDIKSRNLESLDIEQKQLNIIVFINILFIAITSFLTIYQFMLGFNLSFSLLIALVIGIFLSVHYDNAKIILSVKPNEIKAPNKELRIAAIVTSALVVYLPFHPKVENNYKFQLGLLDSRDQQDNLRIIKDSLDLAYHRFDSLRELSQPEQDEPTQENEIDNCNRESSRLLSTLNANTRRLENVRDDIDRKNSLIIALERSKARHDDNRPKDFELLPEWSKKNSEFDHQISTEKGLREDLTSRAATLDRQLRTQRVVYSVQIQKCTELSGSNLSSSTSNLDPIDSVERMLAIIELDRQTIRDSITRLSLQDSVIRGFYTFDPIKFRTRTRVDRVILRINYVWMPVMILMVIGLSFLGRYPLSRKTIQFISKSNYAKRRARSQKGSYGSGGSNKAEENLHKKFFIESIEVHEVDIFGSFNWRLKKQVNILLGKNGYGKSHLFRLIIAMLTNDDDPIKQIFTDKEEDFQVGSDYQQRDISESELRMNVIVDGDLQEVTFNVEEGLISSIGKLPILAIPDIRSISKHAHVVTQGDDPYNNLLEFGGNHFLDGSSYARTIENLLVKIGISLVKSSVSEKKSARVKLLEKIVVQLADFPFEFKSATQIEGTASPSFEINVITDGNQTPIPINKASQGTLSVLAIFSLIYDFLKGLSNHQEYVSRPQEAHAIVIIDEVDAHLHPKWQQKIVELLRESFPNVQFILTAHSPFVVAGSKENEVSSLWKDLDGKAEKTNGFVVESYAQDFIGIKTNEIYEDLFDTAEYDEYYNQIMSKDLLDRKEKIDHLKSRKDQLDEREKSELSKLREDEYYHKQLIGRKIEQLRQEIEATKDLKIPSNNSMKIDDLEKKLDHYKSLISESENSV